MPKILPIAAALTLAAAAAPALAAEAPPAEAIFDPFDTLSTERWYVADGWSNGPHQNCLWTRDKATVADGRLTLALTAEPRESDNGESRDFACAEIQTKRRLGPGLYEARMKAAPGSGLVSAFFTYVGPTDGEEHDEIDVEIPGRSPGRMQTNLYTAGKGGREETHPIPAGEFVTYAIDWRPDRIRWYVDGTLVREATENLPDADAHVFFSLWNGGKSAEGWLGRLDRDAVPASVEVDWFGYTPPGARCLFPDSISCRDDWSEPAG